MKKLILLLIVIILAKIAFCQETQVSSFSPFRTDVDNFESVCNKLNQENWQYAMYYTVCGEDTLSSIAMLNYLYGKNIGFLEFFFDENDSLYCVRFTNQVTRQTIYYCDVNKFVLNKTRHYDLVSQTWDEFKTNITF